MVALCRLEALAGVPAGARSARAREKVRMGSMTASTAIMTMSTASTGSPSGPSTMPIIALSSMVSPAAIERGRLAGFHDYVAKFDRPGLIAAGHELTVFDTRREAIGLIREAVAHSHLQEPL